MPCGVWFGAVSCNQIKLKTKQNFDGSESFSPNLHNMHYTHSHCHRHTHDFFWSQWKCVEKEKKTTASARKQWTHTLNHSLMICIFCYAHSKSAFTRRRRSEMKCLARSMENNKLSLSWAWLPIDCLPPISRQTLLVFFKHDFCAYKKRRSNLLAPTLKRLVLNKIWFQKCRFRLLSVHPFLITLKSNRSARLTCCRMQQIFERAALCCAVCVCRVW